jgi:hypothetical protein
LYRNKPNKITAVKLNYHTIIANYDNIPQKFKVINRATFNSLIWSDNCPFNILYHTVLFQRITKKIKPRKHVIEHDSLLLEITFIKKLKVRPIIKEFLYLRIYNANPWSSDLPGRLKTCVFCLNLVKLEHITRIQCYNVINAFPFYVYNSIINNNISKYTFSWAVWKTFNYISHKSLNYTCTNSLAIYNSITKYYNQDIPKGEYIIE